MTNNLTMDEHLNRVSKNIEKAFVALESKGVTISLEEEETPSDALERAINNLEEVVGIDFFEDTQTLVISTNRSQDETSQY